MATEKEFEAETERQALELACEAFGVEKDGLDYTIVDMGSAGLFGMGARPVKIKASVAGSTHAEPEKVTPEPKPAPVAEVDASEEEAVEAASVAEEAPTFETEPADEAKASSEARPKSSEPRRERPPGIVGPAPEKAAQAKEVAHALVSELHMAAEIDVRDEETEIVVVLTEKDDGTDVADLLGSTRPPALPSFQFLLNKIVNRFPENRKHIVVEATSVSERITARKAEAAERRKQNDNAPKKTLPDDIDEEMVALARELVEKANALGKVITILPMSAGDRRAIHQTVMTIEDAETISEGEGLFRRIHVVPDALRNKRSSGRRRRRGGGRDRDRAEAKPEEVIEVNTAPDEGAEEAPIAAVEEAPASTEPVAEVESAIPVEAGRPSGPANP